MTLAQDLAALQDPDRRRVALERLARRALNEAGRDAGWRIVREKVDSRVQGKDRRAVVRRALEIQRVHRGRHLTPAEIEEAMNSQLRPDLIAKIRVFVAERRRANPDLEGCDLLPEVNKTFGVNISEPNFWKTYWLAGGSKRHGVPTLVHRAPKAPPAPEADAAKPAPSASLAELAHQAMKTENGGTPPAPPAATATLPHPSETSTLTVDADAWVASLPECDVHKPEEGHGLDCARGRAIYDAVRKLSRNAAPAPADAPVPELEPAPRKATEATPPSAGVVMSLDTERGSYHMERAPDGTWSVNVHGFQTRDQKWVVALIATLFDVLVLEQTEMQLEASHG